MMGKRTILTEADLEEIYNQYRAGKSRQGLAARFAISHERFQSIIDIKEIIKIPPLYKEPRLAEAKCAARVAGGMPGADYLLCPVCHFHWWNAYGGPIYCPRCWNSRTLIAYRANRSQP